MDIDLSTPISTEELDYLQDFFLERPFSEDEEIDDGIITLSELDGFLTAVVSGPSMIPPSSWMPHLWGDNEPEWKTQDHFTKVFNTIFKLSNRIAAILSSDTGLRPIFMQREIDGKTQTVTDEWCYGYWRGIQVSENAWGIETNEELEEILSPILIYALVSPEKIYDAYKEQGVPLDNLPDMISETAIIAYDYWLEKRADNPFQQTSSPITTGKQPGRNDPCPCGSGKKYKKCCLH